MNILFVGASSEIASNVSKKLNFNIYGISRKKNSKYKKIYLIKDYNKSKINSLIKKIDVKFDNVFIFNGKYNQSLLKFFDIKEFNSTLNANFFIPIIIINKLISMNKIREKSSINFISSEASSKPDLGNAYYSISKNVVNFSVKILSKEYEKKGIRFNSISLGFVKTKFATNILENYLKKHQSKIMSKHGKKFVSIGDIVKIIKKICLNKKFNGRNFVLKQSGR
jgi:3-oxoacyl-[acyl-carrier protein] reductase